MTTEYKVYADYDIARDWHIIRVQVAEGLELFSCDAVIKTPLTTKKIANAIAKCIRALDAK